MDFKLTRVVLHFEGHEPVTLDAYDQADINIEHGIKHFHTRQGFDEMGYTDQKRAMIRLWSGCEKFEDFVPLSAK